MDSQGTALLASITQEIKDQLKRWESDPSPLLQVLIGLQNRFNHIPTKAIELLSESLEKPAAEINSIIQFYSFLSGENLGRYDIRFSDNIIEQMKGSRELASHLALKLGVSIGTPSEEKSLCIDFTSCTGMSDQAPSLLINGLAIPRLDPARIDTIAQLISEAKPVSDWPINLFQINPGLVQSGPLLNCPYAPGKAISKARTLGKDGTLSQIEASGLRGRGGAGFSTASKWRFCQQASDGNAIVVCNADEGEPGTFKDRLLLQNYAAQVIEGMTICAATVGARHGFIYLRGEYRFLLGALEQLLEERRAAGLLGTKIGGDQNFEFDISIHMGAGAYICGEESALIESLEGKRGVPRARPPFPVTQGYLGLPTVVNNVETYCAVTAILTQGSEWYNQHGVTHSSGTKLLSISGDCAHPGIYEIEFGTSLADILESCGAENPQAVQIGGPAGHLIPATKFDRGISFNDLPTGGSIMIFNRRRSILDIAKNFTQFFAHESCGFCTPCRVGTTLLNKQLDKVIVGHATNEDLKAIKTIGTLMCEASHCGLGQTASNPIHDAIKNFPESFVSHLRSTRFEPAFDLDAALGEAREITQRSDPKAYLKGGGV